MGGALPSPAGLLTGMAQDLGVISKPASVATPVQQAPTTAVLSQSSATNATAQNSVRRGKSPAILTSPYGLDPNATLGKPTLLGS